MVCIPRLLVVAVSLKNYAVSPLLHMSDKKVNTAVLVYYKKKRIARTYYTLDIYPLKNTSISKTLEVYPLKKRPTS